MAPTVCVRMCVQIGACVCVCVCTNISARVCMITCVEVGVCVYKQVCWLCCLDTCECMCVCACVCACTCVCLKNPTRSHSTAAVSAQGLSLGNDSSVVMGVDVIRSDWCGIRAVCQREGVAASFLPFLSLIGKRQLWILFFLLLSSTWKCLFYAFWQGSSQTHTLLYWVVIFVRWRRGSDNDCKDGLVNRRLFIFSLLFIQTDLINHE